MRTNLFQSPTLTFEHEEVDQQTAEDVAASKDVAVTEVDG